MSTMSLTPTPRRVAPLLLLMLATAGCSGSRLQAPAAKAPCAPCEQPPVAEAPPRSPADPGDVTLAELDRALAQWDAAQASGRMAEADALAQRIAALTDGAYALVAGAARGERGQAGTYVGTMALAFSKRPEATAVVADRLAERDVGLVANALVALKLRADPATPLAPIVAHVASPHADLRRYAPLALARVLEARRRTSEPLDPVLASQALQRLLHTRQDQDPIVRLHVARALGELGGPEAAAALLAMVGDTSSRVALGAAAALARCGDRPGFERVLHLLHNSTPDAQPLVAGTLVVYAERLQGGPLSAAEISYLGASAPAWGRWYAEFVKRQPAATPAPRPLAVPPVRVPRGAARSGS